MLLPGCFSEALFPPVSPTLLASAPSALAQHPPVQGSLVWGQKTKTGSLRGGQVAGKEEESMGRGRWSPARKAGVPEWRTSRLEQKMGKFQWQEWKGGQTGSHAAFTGWRVCSPPERSSWREAYTPAIQLVWLSASLSPVLRVRSWGQLGLWGWLGEGTAYWGTCCIHKTSVASGTTNIFWCEAEFWRSQGTSSMLIFLTTLWVG